MTAVRADTGDRAGSRPHFAGLALSLLALGLTEVHAAGPSTAAAREALALPAATGTIERMPLREILQVLAKPHQATIFLDRRINPDALITATLPAATLQAVLQTLGAEHGFSVTFVESVIYLGPAETAGRLRTLDRLRREEARKLPPRIARALLADATLEWADLASPRDLVQEVCRRANLSVSNPEKIPHDLWAAGRLPNLPRVTQLTILLAGFDLTFDCASPGVATVRPVHADERWQQTYRLPRARNELADEIRSAFPGAVLTVERDQLHVAGLFEEHEIIREWLRHGRRPSASKPPPLPARVDAQSPATRYTLRVVRRPLAGVLQEIERSTPYRFAYDRERLEQDGVSLDRMVSFEVAEAEIDGLLHALLDPAGLTWRREGFQVEIRGAEPTQESAHKEPPQLQIDD